MLVPAWVDFYFYDIDWHVFLISAAVSQSIGWFMIFSCRGHGDVDLTVRDIFILTILSWMASLLCGALPVYLSHFSPSFLDAVFESTSALTTTGITLLEGRLESLSVLTLWLCLLQWLGGIGIVVMAVTILPFLKIGGMQLFRAESSDRSEKVMPRFSQMARAIVGVYLFFSVLGVVALWGGGMEPFDAVCYSLSSISTGGITTSKGESPLFQQPFIESVLVFLMLVGSSPFVLWVQAWRQSPKVFWRDEQFRGYLCLIMICVGLNTFLSFTNGSRGGESFHSSLFNIVSLLSSTGYMIRGEDHHNFSTILFFFLMFIGGCTGSTSGGIKIFRFQILISAAWVQLRQSLYPHGVFVARYNEQSVQPPVLISVMTYLTLFGFSYLFLALGLTCFKLDFLTALVGAASTLMNVGIDLVGSSIGSSGEFMNLPFGAKLLLMIGMILGRLEFVTVILLFMPSFWRR